jgi:hypothetical protein
LSGVQFLKQDPVLFQIARVEAFGEPAVYRSQQFASLLHLALVAAMSEQLRNRVVFHRRRADPRGKPQPLCVFALVRGQVSSGDERIEFCVGHANLTPHKFVVAVPRATRR